MSYAFPKEAKDGDVVSLSNGVRYQYQAEKDRWMVKSVVDPDKCPRFKAIALQYKDYNNPKEQLIINWWPDATQDGVQNVGWSEIRLANFLQSLDPNKNWISIGGQRHQIHSTSMIGGDPVYEMKSSEGNLTSYVGSVVEVHNCEDDE